MTRRRSFHGWPVQLGAVLALVGCPCAVATQLPVKPGSDWAALATRVKPGDEIILMPSKHRDATFESLMGTADRPITIRGADPQSPPLIEARLEGLRIKRAAHLVIKDLQIVGGTVSGMTLGDRPSSDPAGGALADPGNQHTTSDELQSLGNIAITNVSIKRVGPRGQRHGLSLTGLVNVRLDGCLIEGWGGSGIEIVACRDVSILRCTLRGLHDHGQVHGMRARAGTDRVQIESCIIEHAGERSVSMGGASELGEFRSLPEKPEGKLFEASRINVERCVIIGSRCPIVFVNADDCLVRNNTIIRPRKCVMALLAEQQDPRFTPGVRNVFGLNLIYWEPGDVDRFAEVRSREAAATFLMEENLWWSGEDEQKMNRLGPLPGKTLSPQTMDVDPQLQQDTKPANPAAKAFGA